MNYETSCIKTIEQAADFSGQQNIEADIVLPDYYDTIGKILRCNLIPLTEAVTPTEEKISVAGIAKLEILYCGENKKIYHYENEYKYTKIFQVKSYQTDKAVKINQDVFSVNCKALGPKRIEVRAVLMIRGNYISLNEQNVISDINDSAVVARMVSHEILNPVTVASREFCASQVFNLADESEKLVAILRKSSRVTFNEIKPIRNKIYVKGVCDCEIVGVTEAECDVKKLGFAVGFSEIIEISDVEENDICKIQENYVYCDSVIHSENTDNYELDLRVSIGLLINVFRKESITLADDAYSLNNKLNADSCELTLYKSLDKLSETEKFSFDIDLYEDEKIKIFDVSAENIKITTEKRSDKIIGLVTADYYVIYADSNNTTSIACKEHTIEAEIAITHDSLIMNSATAKVLLVNDVQMREGKIKIEGEVFIEMLLINTCKANGFTEIALTDDENFVSSGYVIYFGKSNEELWSIAKENRTSVELIMQMNNLKDDILHEDKVLLLPKF